MNNGQESDEIKVITGDEISSFLSQIHNKYSNNAEKKYLNQMYDIGILIANKKFNQQKLTDVINKILDKKSTDPIKKISDEKRKSLLDALKRGIKDGMSDDYMMAYNNSNKYQYDPEKLKKRARLDCLMNQF